MKDTLVTFETAKLAKERGFNELCRHIYPTLTFNSYEEDKAKTFYYGELYEYTLLDSDNPIFYAPTQSLLQMWLRIKYNILVFAIFDDEINEYGYHIWDKVSYSSIIIIRNSSYEDALEAGLQQALKLIKS